MSNLSTTLISTIYSQHYDTLWNPVVDIYIIM